MSVIMKKKLMIFFSILSVFLVSVSTSAAALKASGKYAITQYGAIGDGKTLNTTSIQKAIDACSENGGGTVVVPEGKFITGAVYLKKGVNLYIAEGGMLKGSVNQADYQQINTRWEGIERVWTSALINAIGLNNIKIYGEGTIDGSGTEWPSFARLGGQPRQQISQAARDSIMRIPRPGRPRMICFQNCSKVQISGLKLRDQAVWCLHILYCKDVLVKNLDIRAAHTIPSSDGIDIDSSNGVLVTGCYIDDNDDCISIKAGKDEDGLRVNRPCENIIVKKCRFGYGHGGVAMGSEVSGGIRNVKILSCDVDSGNWAPIRFKSQPSRGGVVENIVYKNIRIRDAKQAFEFNLEWRMVPPIAPPAKVLTVVRNVRFINVSGKVSSLGIIHGLPESPVCDVKFINCNLDCERGLTVENVRDIDYSGLKASLPEEKRIIQK